MEKGKIIVLNGLSGSGKTTLGNLIEKYLNDNGKPSFLLDGDYVRNFFGNDLKFTIDDRLMAAKRVAYGANLLSENGINVIMAVVMGQKELRELYSSKFEFIEIFLDASIDDCIKNDPRGIYSRNLKLEKPNITGYDLPFNRPQNPPITVHPYKETPSESFKIIRDFLDLKFSINKKKIIKKIVYVRVTADLFHYGHLHMLEFAKSCGDYLVCGVLSDNAIQEKGIRPVMPFEERKKVLSAVKIIDRVIVQENADPTNNLRKIHEEFPDSQVIFIYSRPQKKLLGEDYVKEIDGKIIQYPYYNKLSRLNVVENIISLYQKNLVDFTEFTDYFKNKNFYEFKKDSTKTIVSTKANTLKALSPLLKKSKIEPSLFFTVLEWNNQKQEILSKIKKGFSSSKVVVRSSAINEDTLDKSMAGCFRSYLNIDVNDDRQLETSIEDVISSYKEKASESSFNQVLVQSQTENIDISGVVFTRNLDDNSPYYVINYDDSTGQSDTVTKGVENKSLMISRFAEDKNIPDRFKNLIMSIKEIEDIIPSIGLDIEFAINKNKEVIIFQVRPLAASMKRLEFADSAINDRISSLKKRFLELSVKKSHLSGKRNIFADMPDWNPAEIIGNNPNHLDYSLYDYIITDSAWHYARTSQGYYDVNPAKLVVLFGNKPYIDVRNTFNSFVPNAISPGLKDKLVDFYLEKLERNPHLQDKVEFDILYTCYDLCFDDKRQELLQAGFSLDEIEELKNALINLTNRLIINSKESIKNDLEFVKEIENNKIDSIDLEKSSVKDLLLSSRLLLDNCKNKGTVQFSRLARLGFIGKIILKSLVKQDIIDNDFYYRFMNSIRTVATELKEDFIKMSDGSLKKQEFIEKYYHLRPGSYDITSMRYDSNENLIDVMNIELPEQADDKLFILDKETQEKIDMALKNNGLKFNAIELLEFIKDSLEAREFSKFEFTKNLSNAIELISLSGKKMGFTRNELAMLDLGTIFSNIDEGQKKYAEYLKEIISSRLNERTLNNLLILPSIIFSTDDFDVVKPYVSRPNFITQKKIQGKIVKLENLQNIPDLKDKIVMIENGDPGYDWIFTKNIAGLITKYGGVASHMSIRCAEFNLPAAIGCGALYDRLKGFEYVTLDCGFGKLIPLGDKIKC